jgi:hypothetical protein
MSVFNLYVFEELERKSSPEVGISAALVRRLNFNRLTFLWETSLESYGAFYLMGAIPGPDDPPQLGEAAANLLARFLGVEAVVLRGGAVRVVRSGAFGQPATLGAFASSAAPGGPKPGVEATPRTEGVTGASELLKAERERRRAEEAAAEHLSSGKAKPSR